MQKPSYPALRHHPVSAVVRYLDRWQSRSQITVQNDTEHLGLTESQMVPASLSLEAARGWHRGLGI